MNFILIGLVFGGIQSLIIWFLHKRIKKLNKDLVVSGIETSQARKDINYLKDLQKRHGVVNAAYHKKIEAFMAGKLNYVELPKDATNDTDEASDS